MLFTDSYYTLDAPAEAVFKDRGSRFMAFAIPVKSEDEIKDHLQELRRAHPAARHHCYAWVLGPGKSAWRANDDGEPSGSAGRPILAQINAKDLTNVLIVVVRYFGGTLLGVGGLINAYRSAGAAAIEAGRIVEKHILFEYDLDYDTADTSRVMRLLKELDATIVSTAYEDRSRLRFLVKKKDAGDIEQRFSDLYTAKLSYIKTDMT